MLIWLTVTGKLGSLKFRGGCLPHHDLGAVFTPAGQLFTLHALHAGEVSVVRPIVKTTPLFIIIFTEMFLWGE